MYQIWIILVYTLYTLTYFKIYVVQTKLIWCLNMPQTRTSRDFLTTLIQDSKGCTMTGFCIPFFADNFTNLFAAEKFVTIHGKHSLSLSLTHSYIGFFKCLPHIIGENKIFQNKVQKLFWNKWWVSIFKHYKILCACTCIFTKIWKEKLDIT